jgi:hypothetical protein
MLSVPLPPSPTSLEEVTSLEYMPLRLAVRQVIHLRCSYLLVVGGRATIRDDTSTVTAEPGLGTWLLEPQSGPELGAPSLGRLPVARCPGLLGAAGLGERASAQ